VGDGTATVVVADASVLINLIHVEMLPLLGALEGLRFVTPAQVVEEISRPEHAAALGAALTHGHLSQEESTDPVEIAVYAELSRVLGRGEAASLAMAQARGWMIACDERRRFAREAQERLGDGRLFNTPGLILLAIRRQLISVEEADEIKRRLDARRFKMSFRSFADLL
jgi:predicted nucleic acid-binding protein